MFTTTGINQPNQPSPEKQAEGREKALQNYRIIAGLMGVCSVGIFIAAILAATKYNNPDSFGFPYYIGGFISGILGMGHTAISVLIIVKIPQLADDDIKKRELGCAITGQYILSMFIFMGSFMGIMMAGIGGVGSSSDLYDEDPYREQSRTIAICIIVGCIIILAVNIFSMCTVCTYGAFFGVHITSGRRRVMVLQNQTMYSNTGNSAVHNAQMQNLQLQNQLLQQQLQQQQQQQGFGGAYPPPPPSYSTVAGGNAPNPAFPPPSYGK